MAEPIEFFFDFSSPYGYIASCRIDDLAARFERVVKWRPFMLGAAFKIAGTQPLTEYPLKGAYSRYDFDRSARLYGIPFNMPAKFPIPTTAAARGFYWLDQRDPATARRFAQAVYRAYFADGRDISDPAIVGAVAGQNGLDAAALLEAIQTPEAKARLKAESDAALERGVFGSPFIFADGEPFWGADRLDMLARWLETGGW